MNKDQLKNLIESTLKGIGKYSPEAVDLLMGTAAQESNLGYYIKQLGNGLALGIFQTEPNTFIDICNNYLRYRDSVRQSILKECRVHILEPEMLEYNLKVAICFARLQYLRQKGSIPTDIEGMAKYYKEHYNTPLGKATEEEFINNYKKYVG